MKKKRDYIDYEDGTRVYLDEDDAPELGEEFFKNARPFKEVLPELYASWEKKRGRPKKAAPKKATTIRLDADVVAYFKAAGPGWQSRINAFLRAAVDNLPR